ncbi:probable inactive purple acid phosphatase 29 [Spinacia oleracea]|uniref:Probable inactive purple acid phosphatase 29 n=1 Tax=Spinacia oleracea TaxID=3562 RepID=A0ABM3RDZ1_SPIOL|nr:probable inactive purple acid phosphatase 29 [Spinacia oleracea]
MMVTHLFNKRAHVCAFSGVKTLFVMITLCICTGPTCAFSTPLRFNKEGAFKILQVADMHYADGKITPCLDVLPNQVKGCSDLNTTAFIQRMIKAENPDLIVFTGARRKKHIDGA